MDADVPVRLLKSAEQRLDAIGGECFFGEPREAENIGGVIVTRWVRTVQVRGKRGVSQGFDYFSNNPGEDSLSSVLESLQNKAKLGAMTYRDYLDRLNIPESRMTRDNYNKHQKTNRMLRKAFGPDFKVLMGTELSLAPPF